jgi:NAD+ kinase
MIIKRVGILYHPLNPATQTKAQEISEYLISKGLQVWTTSSWEKDNAVAQLDGTDLIITTGGDGTLLRAAQAALMSQTPIVGVNLGTLGFMTELSADEAINRLPEIIAGHGWIDERAMLEAEVTPNYNSQTHPANTFCALNDVVMARGAIARLVQIKADIDDKTITTYRADGVILSTATGSTGYSLAAGGPILYPRSQDWLLVPIVPHLGLNYSLVLPSSGRVSLQISTAVQATLSIDGHINIPVSNGSIVNVKMSTQKTRFLRIHTQDYFFSTLEDKLKRKK